MEKVFEIASRVSHPLGIAGITVATLFFISREILRKNIFPTLTKNLSAGIIRLLIHRLFVLALVSMVLGFGGFALTMFREPHVSETSNTDLPYGGQLVDERGHAIHGAEVRIRDSAGTIQEKISDSEGSFQYYIKDSTKPAHFTVIAKGFEQYDREITPSQTSREAFILKESKATPLTTPTSTLVTQRPRTRPQPSPCPAEDRLVGKC